MVTKEHDTDPIDHAEDEALVEAWGDLKEREPELAYRMLLVRFMIEQRGISIRNDLSPMLDSSYESIYTALRPTRIRADEDPYISGSITVSYAHRWMDRIEEAVSQITAERGGVFTMTGATPESRLGWQDYVHEYASRRMTDDYED